MKNKILCTLSLLLCLLLTACGHEHTFSDATCTAPMTCSECGITEGEALGHTFVDATCETAKTCSVCGATEGNPLEHSWIEATTEAPKTCELCGLTDGEPLVVEETETEEETEEETEVVEEETTESSDEQLVSSLNLPEDERQFYMQQFGLSSEELDNLTVTRLYELIDGYLNSLIDGGGSSSGGGSSTGGGSDNSGSNGGDEGNHESNPWGLPVTPLNPDDGSLPGNM